MVTATPDKAEPVKNGAGASLVTRLIRRRWFRVLTVIVLAAAVIIAVAVIGLFVYEPSPSRDFPFSAAGKTIRLSDGRALAYLETGDSGGRPLFYFHGGPGSRLEALRFDELSRQLGIRMIATDRPGYGRSDFQEDRTYLDWPKDVGELADQLGIERFAVLGWSSGGPHAAAVAHGIPERVTVAAIVAGEGPYASDDLPRSVLASATFSGSRFNKLLIWSANKGPWLMRALFRMMRVQLFSDPVGLVENSDDGNMCERDRQFFTRDFPREVSAELVEAFRQGARGATRDFTIERLAWPFKLEEVQTPTVLVFHGEEDSMVHPGIAEYVCGRIPSCDGPTVFPGEGHSVVYYRYEEIAGAMLDAWE